jgi:hypothetical protein
MDEVIKARPGTYKGVRYRSQLEIKWAKWLAENGIDHHYDDAPWYDFTICGARVEIKPAVAEVVYEAVERALSQGSDLILPGEMCHLIAGEPPSIYSRPIHVTAISLSIWSRVLCVARVTVLGAGRYAAVPFEWWIGADKEAEIQFIQHVLDK